MVFFVFYYWRDIIDPQQTLSLPVRRSDCLDSIATVLNQQADDMIKGLVKEEDKAKKYEWVGSIDIAQVLSTIFDQGTYDGYIPVMSALFSTDNKEYVRRLKELWQMNFVPEDDIKGIFRTACKEYLEDENTKEEFKGFFIALQMSVYDMDFSTYESALAAAQVFYKKIEEADFRKINARVPQG